MVMGTSYNPRIATDKAYFMSRSGKYQKLPQDRY